MGYPWIVLCMFYVCAMCVALRVPEVWLRLATQSAKTQRGKEKRKGKKGSPIRVPPGRLSASQAVTPRRRATDRIRQPLGVL
ncbi:hypothetical protein LY76DRAFT_217301 [Colletotrichum caudatum]|nr:hypothetical protein LY76DRAFT_217301 [Colletotrichum caudatum]